MGYHHVQQGCWHYVVSGSSAVVFVIAWLARGDPGATIALSIAGVLVLAIGFGFAQLTVEDEVDRLAVRYGPLPLFWRRIPYARITAVEPDRTRLLDGWGIHYGPGRGWTYNLWGFDCVKLSLGDKVIRIGTDDLENLVAFLQARISQPR